MPVRIADIAAAANVSPATVARVVSNSGYVSEGKRQQVNRVIDELGYVPNRIASSLRKNKPYFIGHVMLVSSENPFFARIGSAVNDAAEKAGYHVLMASRQADAARERAVIENLLGLMVDAIIFTGDLSSDTKTINWVLSRGVPVVMVERPRHGSSVDAVLLDSYAGAAMAVEHIIAAGHRDIGFIGLKYQKPEVEYQRYNGFACAMRGAGLKIRSEWVRYASEYTVEDGRKATEELLAQNRLPTAVFVTSDVIACGALQAFYSKGMRVPEDMSIVGFDNTLSSLCTPPLTSIDMQLEQAGTTAVDMIVERKRDGREGVKTVTFSPVLINRGSVRQIT
ncbi:LacI family transcriptional regulator [Clostridia bacterium]|nr:LacI family transcriptional regulator [Clostridia bacterium]